MAHGLPSLNAQPTFADTGGLISFGADYNELSRRAAGYVARILNGDNPGELPVQQPERFELILNLKTAEALGLTVPTKFMYRVTQVIE